MGYLVSQYPAPSHTFIRREVEALRGAGVRIDTFSIRRPAAGDRQSDGDRRATIDTNYVLPIGIVRLLSAHGRAFAARPARYVRVFALALKHRTPGLRAFLWSLFHFAEAIVLADALHKRGITRLHNHFANAGANVGLLASRFLGLPWSLTLHGISETDYPAGLLLGAKIEAAEFVACVSWFGRAQAMRITSTSHWPKLTIVRCGLDLGVLPGPKPGGRPEGCFTLICVARLSAEKGHLGLLQAFSALVRSGVDVRLELVGDGPEREFLQAECGRRELLDVVTFVGQLDEEATLARISEADALVLPSLMEGLPIVLMEAMALGVPVIGPHVAGVPELIEKDAEGLLFRPGDWEDLADAVSRLATDAGLRARLTLAARAKIEREFAIERAVAPLISRFERDGIKRGETLAAPPLEADIRTAGPARPPVVDWHPS